jgi:hypothetical protein
MRRRLGGSFRGGGGCCGGGVLCPGVPPRVGYDRDRWKQLGFGRTPLLWVERKRAAVGITVAPLRCVGDARCKRRLSRGRVVVGATRVRKRRLCNGWPTVDRTRRVRWATAVRVHARVPWHGTKRVARCCRDDARGWAGWTAGAVGPVGAAVGITNVKQPPRPRAVYNDLWTRAKKVDGCEAGERSEEQPSHYGA